MSDIPQDMYKAAAPFKSGELSVLIMTANNTHDLEFFYPYYRFVEEGFNVDVTTPQGGEFKGKMGMGLKQTKSITDIDEAQYDLLYIPGGKAPAELKENSDALALTKRFARNGRLIAAICHGAQVLAATGIIRGKNIAAWPEVEDEIIQAGGSFVNQPTVTDGQFITARWPGDLPSHLAATIKTLRTRQGKAEVKPEREKLRAGSRG